MGTLRLPKHLAFCNPDKCTPALVFANPQHLALIANTFILHRSVRLCRFFQIRMQAQGNVINGGMMGNFINIYQQEGTRGLWKVRLQNELPRLTGSTGSVNRCFRSRASP